MKLSTTVMAGCRLAVFVIAVSLFCGCRQPLTQPDVSKNTNSESRVADVREVGKTASQDDEPAALTGTQATNLTGDLVESTGTEATGADDSLASTDQGFSSTDFEDDPVDAPEVQTIDIPESWTRVAKDYEIWIDRKAKKVIVAGHVALRAGGLEMFICPRRTKEHESVISVNTTSQLVHASLIVVGADPGKPVEWEPEYKPASGPIIDITVSWMDGEKLVSRSGRDMIRNFKTGEALEHDWVFGGSQIYEDEETGQSYYYGNAGELACVSNFSTATMDLNIESSEANGNLLFEAFTENIPEVATKVYVEFKPRLE